MVPYKRKRVLYAITVKCIKRMQEKVDRGDLSVATKIKKATIKNFKEILRGGKQMVPCCIGVAFH